MFDFHLGEIKISDLFEKFYDNDVISMEAFKMWKDSVVSTQVKKSKIFAKIIFKNIYS